VLTLAAALVVFSFVYLTVGRYSTLSHVGSAIFSGLSGFGILYALVAGPLATADCLSRERREGTLGLLFLTDLRGHDVVLGKLVATSMDMALSLTAALPLLAMPLLVGGVTLTQFGVVVLALLDVMFLSLAIGMCASSFCASGRTALGIAIAVLSGLALGMPFLGEALLRLSTNGSAAGLFYAFCPLWTLGLCLNAPISGHSWKLWANLTGMNLLGWFCLALACRRTATSWRDLPVSPLVLKLRSWWERFRKSRRRSQLAWRQQMLEHNPVGWLDGRDRIQESILSLIIVACAVLWAVKHLQSPQRWPSNDDLFLWPIFSHYTLCLWLAIQAPRRFADDKSSGALELLLCTPLPSGQIVRGAMSLLWRRFGRAMAALVVLDAFVVNAHISEHGGWADSRWRTLIELGIYAALVFPLQGYALARGGLYQGLTRANSLRATFRLVWTLGVMPWILFIGFILTCDLTRRSFSFFPRLTEHFLFASWAGAHLLVFAASLSHTQWQLSRNFRALATTGSRRVWWRRWRSTRTGAAPQP